MSLTPTAQISNQADVAQSEERLHGKEKAKGSIPFIGSVSISLL